MRLLFVLWLEDGRSLGMIGSGHGDCVESPRLLVDSGGGGLCWDPEMGSAQNITRNAGEESETDESQRGSGSRSRRCDDRSDKIMRAKKERAGSNIWKIRGYKPAPTPCRPSEIACRGALCVVPCRAIPARRRIGVSGRWSGHLLHRRRGLGAWLGLCGGRTNHEATGGALSDPSAAWWLHWILWLHKMPSES